MHIAQVSVSTLPVLHRYGSAIARRNVDVAREQARRGHEVRVYSVGDESETRQVEGINYHFLKCRTALPWRHLEFQLKTVSELKKARRPDVLHFHSQPEGAVLARAV